MRCLLDKATARHIMEGMLKLVEGRSVTFTDTELFALHYCHVSLPIVERPEFIRTLR